MVKVALPSLDTWSSLPTKAASWSSIDHLFGGGGCIRTPLPTGLITYVQYLYLNALLLTAFEHLRTSLVYLLTYCTSITFCVIQQNLQTGNESVPIQLAQCSFAVLATSNAKI